MTQFTPPPPSPTWRKPEGDFKDPHNKLFIGDNLPILRHLANARTDPDSDFNGADLIYLDPPFNSQAIYNLAYGVENSTEQSRAAFTDTWTFDEGRFEKVLEDLEAHNSPANTIKFLKYWREVFGDTGKAGEELAYLAHMVPRLEAMHGALKPTGSIYLHCDSTAVHALKKVMDLIFGRQNFRNDVIWKRHSAKNNAVNVFGSIHDNLLFYSKTSAAKKNVLFVPYDEGYTDSVYNNVDSEGRKFGHFPLYFSARGENEFEFMGVTRNWRHSLKDLQKMQSEGRIYVPRNGRGVPRRKVYVTEAEGNQVQDIWSDIPSLSNSAKERVGYPTQKPIALLKRVIQASSNPGGVVLDPYCGCGTTIETCLDLEKQGEGRRYIGIDLERTAARVMQARIETKSQREECEYPPIKLSYGPPCSAKGFDDLANNGAHIYCQFYAVNLIPRCLHATNEEKERLGLDNGGPGDNGIDGLIPVRDKNGEVKYLVISVKAGNNVPAHSVRDLVGVLDLEGRPVVGGVLITRKGELTVKMRAAINKAGYENGLAKLRHVTIAKLWKTAHSADEDDHTAWAETLGIPVKMLENAPDLRKRRKSL